MSTFITVAIPYVNATPHLGYAFELIEADLAAPLAARWASRFGSLVGRTTIPSRMCSQPKRPVSRARRSSIATRRFADLPEPLAISFDDFIQTSTDPRHRPAVERLWRACADNDDLYRRDYEGFYCVGCEQFYEPAN